MSTLVGWAGVGLLSMFGALARFVVGGAIQRRTRSVFPVATLVVNLTGSLALGVLAGAGVSGWPLRLVGAALLGSYTTFSTWLFETEVLVERGDRQRAVLNIVASVLLGLGAVAVGWVFGGHL